MLEVFGYPKVLYEINKSFLARKDRIPALVVNMCILEPPVSTWNIYTLTLYIQVLTK